MTNFVNLLLSLTLSGSVLILLIIAIKPYLKSRFSKTFQYYIWGIVLLRLILPFGFEQNLMKLVLDEADSAIATIPFSEALTVDEFPMVSVATEKEGNFKSVPSAAKPIDPVLTVWIVGAIAAFASKIVGYIRFRRRIGPTLLKVQEYESDLLEEYRRKMGIKRRIGIARSRFAPTPMLVGVFKPQIILPDMPFSAEQLKHILNHELTHQKRHDILVKWMVTIVTSVHWFNPLVYLMRKEINRACELSCDEMVIGRLDRAGKQAYGDTLIAVAARWAIPGRGMTTTMSEDRKSLQERLEAIMTFKHKKKISFAVSSLLLFLLVTSAYALGGTAAPVSSDTARPVGSDGTIFPANVDSSEKPTKSAVASTYLSGQGTGNYSIDIPPKLLTEYGFVPTENKGFDITDNGKTIGALTVLSASGYDPNKLIESSKLDDLSAQELRGRIAARGDDGI